jgi:single-strand DNA-binding protein
MIKANLIGNLGQDAKLNILTDGSLVINFSVASSETWKDKNGEKQERTTWISCSMFFKADKKPKVIDYLKKGQLVWIEGLPSAGAYMGKDNKPMPELKIRVDNLLLLGKSKETGTNEAIEEKAD